MQIFKKIQQPGNPEKNHFVYEDLQNRKEPVKIHKYPCYFINLAGNTTTTRWHGPFTYDEAIRVANQLARARGSDWRFAHWCN